MQVTIPIDQHTDEWHFTEQAIVHDVVKGLLASRAAQWTLLPCRMKYFIDSLNTKRLWQQLLLFLNPNNAQQ